MKKTENEKMEFLKQIKELTKDNKRLLFTNLKPSSSGLSRTFNIYAQTKNGLVDISFRVAILTGNTYTKNGKIRIFGCGMDMIFETCYQLNSAYTRLNNLNSTYDLQYHGLVETNYDLI